MHNKDVMLSEYLVDNNLWQAIIATGSLPFLAALSADELNALTSIKYGQRKMFKPYLVPTVDIIAKMLVAEYLEQWGKYNDFLKGISNIAASTGHKITESISDQGNELTTGEIVTKVTAFNSDTFIDDKAVDNHNNVDTVNDRFRTMTDEVFSIKTAFDNLSLLQKTNIINAVVLDTVNYLTVTVY